MQISVKDLRPGMIIITENGHERTVTSLPVACRAKGYYQANTTGEKVISHIANLVNVK